MLKFVFGFGEKSCHTGKLEGTHYLSRGLRRSSARSMGRQNGKQVKHYVPVLKGMSSTKKKVDKERKLEEKTE